MPTILISKKDIAPFDAFFSDARKITSEELEKIEAILTPLKPLAQQIREQLEREEMTVKQILSRNYTFANNTCGWNTLTPREARRRMVERAAEIVREREPAHENALSPCAHAYMVGVSLQAVFNTWPHIGAIYMQSTAQWHLLRDVIGDEGLKELIQK